MKIKFALLVLLMLIVNSVYSQQEAQYSQYMYNTISVNPAYAGSRNVLSVLALHRSQWVGFEGAPTTSTFSINSPIPETNLGLGISAISDRIGPTEQNTLSGDISYTIRLNENVNLSFGIKGTLSFFSFDQFKVTPFQANDPKWRSVSSSLSPNLGVGTFLHSEKYYLGLSIPNIMESNFYNDIDLAINSQRMNYYLIGGYVFDVSKWIKFKPAVVSKIVSGAPVQLDLSANTLFMNKFVLGAAYRWDAAVSGLAGFQLNDALFIGYSYDFDTTSLSRFNYGSHEVFIRYEFVYKKDKLVSPRFF
ncbi:MAG: type IX secretion system membrane protein PorP/SprF [Flavobacteriaceae bacterium]|nr:type IX secretion system membrane protein PorP/SprF [Flavobacteriaceae bacterium]